MDEKELARKAVYRNLLTQEQLREAEGYASGGRSLLSVLLDLGYLRPDQIGDLLGPPSRPASAATSGSPLKPLGLIALVAVGTTVLTRSCTDRIVVAPNYDAPVMVHEFRSIDNVLIDRATGILSNAEVRLRESGSLDADQERLVHRAAALLEEAIGGGSDTAATWSLLGRAQEMLDRWTSADASYRNALAKNSDDDDANLGLARILLLLDRPLQAGVHATAACSGGRAGEAFLVRAKADFNLGNKEEARAHLDAAARRDPTLASQIRALRARLDD